jgi:hypothetical protein
MDSTFNDNEILLYDLANRPASYDFVTCLASSLACGIKHVRFVYGAWKPKNYSLKQAEERWQHIVRPASRLFGIDYSIGERRGVEIPHILRGAIEVYKQMGRIGKIPIPCIPKDYVTLTLRKSRNLERDSNEEESLKFAAGCDRKVIIIRDWDERPISLEDRMTLYAGAYLNIMVMNGPATLCFHSDAPYVVMRVIGCEKSGSTSPASSKANGISPGFQFPWAKPNQKLSYLTDSAENIEFEYRAMEKLIGERKAA